MTGPRLDLKPPTIAELLAQIRAQRDATAAIPTTLEEATQRRLDEERIARNARLSGRTKALGRALGVGKAGLGMAEFPLQVAKAATEDLGPDQLPAAARAGMSAEAQAATTRALAAAQAAQPPGSRVTETLNPLPMVSGLIGGALEGDPVAQGEAAGFAAPLALGLARGMAEPARAASIAERLQKVRTARQARLDAEAGKAPEIPPTFLRRGGQVEWRGADELPTVQRPPVRQRRTPVVPQTLETPTIMRGEPQELPPGAPDFLRRLLAPVQNERGAIVKPPEPPGTPLTPAGPPEFYSRAQTAIENAPFERGTVGQWRAALSKNVNQQELKDVGVGPFLDAQPADAVLTRDDVLAEFDRVELAETQYGGKPAPGVHEAERDLHPPRHSQYQLPGGTNYREIVLHTPPKASKPIDGSWRDMPATTPLADDLNAHRRWVLRDPQGHDLAEIYETAVDDGKFYAYRLFGEHEDARRTRAALEGPVQRIQQLVEQKLGAEPDTPVYTSPSHWPGIKNPVGHLRMNQRTLPDGRTATHVEEFQSDVHEAGREQGYKQSPAEQEKLEQEAAAATHAAAAARLAALGTKPFLSSHEVDLIAGRLRRGFTPVQAAGENAEFFTGAQYERALAYAEAVERAVAAEGAAEAASKGVPKLPFHRTEDWVGLLFRRALAEAVRDGSDVLTWTTGEQQAARWSQALQRGIDEVHWDRQSGELTFYKHGRRLEVHDLPPTGTVEGLTGIVGRDVAENLMRQKEADRVKGFEGGQSVVRGTDLVIGAKGMRTFYDQIVPKVAQEVLKKIGVKDAKPELVEPPAGATTGPRSSWTGDELAELSREAERMGSFQQARTLQRMSQDLSGDEVLSRHDAESYLVDLPHGPAVLERLLRPPIERVSLINLEDAANHLYGMGEVPNSVRAAIIRDLRELREDDEGGFGMHSMHHGNVWDTWADASDVGRDYVDALWEQAVANAREDHPPPPKGEATWVLPITAALKAKIQSGEGMYLYTGLDPRLIKGAGAVAGAAGGAVVGAGTDKEHPWRGALIGGVAGAVGGGLIRKALDARRAGRGVPVETTARTEGFERGTPDAERVLGQLQDDVALGAVGRHVSDRPAARPGGLPVEPPITPTEFVNTAKFDLDPTGKVRLEAEVERVVNEFGLNPKKAVTWAELRETASKLGVDFTEGNRPTSTRMTAPQMLAVRNVVSANVAELERISGELTKPALTTMERDALEGRLRAIEGQNAHLLDRFIRSRSEAGRDLNSLKVIANRVLDPSYWYTKAQTWKGAPLTADEQVTIRRLGEARDRAGLVTFVSGLKKAGLGQQLLTLWKAGLLTNPKTHIVNAVGNVTFGLMETAKDPVAAMVDRLLQLRTGERTKGGITRLTMEAGVRGAGIGLREAKDIAAGKPNPSRVAKLELRPDVSFNNVIGDTYVKTVFNLLEAGDRPFHQAALFRSLAEQAQVAGKKMGLNGVKLREYVEGIQRGEGPLADEIMIQAISDANVATFKDETRLGKAAQSFARTVPGGQIILPFQRAPGAVATRVLEYSPLGLARGLKNAVEVGLKGKGASPALQRAASEQVARGLIGSGAVWLGYELAKHDLMTGAAPTLGSKERQLWMQENRQANSLLIGGQWVNIGRLSPAGNLLALGANLYRAAQQPGANDLATQAINVGAGALKTVADQPFLTGASTALAAIQDPEREGPAFVRGLAGSVVPAVVGAVARGTDVPRTAQVGTGPASGVAGAVAERIPGLRKTLPPKISTLGSRLPSPGWVNALFNPASASPDLRQSDPLIRELHEAGYAVPRPPRQPHESPSDYAARAKLYGVAARQVLEQTVKSPEYVTAQAREQDALAAAAQLRSDPEFRQYPVDQLADAILAQQRKQDPDAKTRAEVLGDAVASVRRQLKAALQ